LIGKLISRKRFTADEIAAERQVVSIGRQFLLG